MNVVVDLVVMTLVEELEELYFGDWMHVVADLVVMMVFEELDELYFVN
jgi:hypothetical protein